MTIGELAGAAGVKVATVRYYERRGVLPEPERDAAGYRVYDRDDLWRLAFVKRAKRLGFTLAEIVDLLEARTAGDGVREVRERAEGKMAALGEEMARLEETRRRLERLVSACAQGLEEACVGLNDEGGNA